MKHKKVTVLFTVLAFAFSILTVVKFGKDANVETIKSDNIASTYVEEYGGYVWGSGKVDPLYKDSYSTSYRQISYDVDEWKIDQWKGPRDKTVKITRQAGTQVSLSSNGQVSYSALEATCGLSLTSTYNDSYEEIITYPGDNRTHYLIQKEEYTAYELSTSITSYKADVDSYDWYPIIGYTNIKWKPWTIIGTYNYNPSGCVNRVYFSSYMTK